MNSTSDLFAGHLSPAEVLTRLLKTKAWTQAELAAVLGCSRWTVIQIMKGRSGVTAAMATRLAHAFGNDPNDWLRVQAQHRLRRVIRPTGVDVERRALIYGRAPVRDMQRRGWIKETSDVDVLEGELKRFYRIQSLDEDPSLVVATRRSTTGTTLTPSQTAWCMQALRMAEALPVARFDPQRFPQLDAKLRELAAYRQEARHLPKILASYGIRFVVVEPLAGVKIDGTAFWLNATSPAIATSIRYDRVDAFWFTVMHECSHIRHGDAISVDTLGDTGNAMAVDNDHETRANNEAATMLIPPHELESFIRRVAPLYSRQRIIQFAHRVKINPAIVVGQLHHRGEIGYSALRDLLEKIRDVVIETTFTDGWGKTVAPGLL